MTTPKSITLLDMNTNKETKLIPTKQQHFIDIGKECLLVSFVIEGKELIFRYRGNGQQ